QGDVYPLGQPESPAHHSFVPLRRRQGLERLVPQSRVQTKSALARYPRETADRLQGLEQRTVRIWPLHQEQHIQPVFLNKSDDESCESPPLDVPHEKCGHRASPVPAGRKPPGSFYSMAETAVHARKTAVACSAAGGLPPARSVRL